MLRPRRCGGAGVIKFRRVSSKLRRWRPLGALTNRAQFDQQYELLPSGQIVRRGPQRLKRRARKDAMQSRSSHPGKLVTSGAPGRRRIQYQAEVER